MTTIKILLFALQRKWLIWRTCICNKKTEVWLKKAEKNINTSQKNLYKSKSIIDKVEKMIYEN